MPATAYEFEGWMGLDKDSAKGHMEWRTFEPKRWEENDVDIKITHCGICGSDLHTLRSGWGPTSYPCCVGHEIVGTVVRVGSVVDDDIKVGDRVGVGAQSDSCLGRKGDCEECASGLEQYCLKQFIGTYDSTHFNGDKTYGGYGLYNRSPSHFVIKIPEELPSEDAAPMLCAGITTYSPLKHNQCGPGKKVGILGLGGLGHFGVLWATALGADKVVAISRKQGKKDDAIKLGADLYIATDDDPDWTSKHARSLDIIVSTVSSSQTPMGDYLSLLRKDGVLIQVGNPEDGVFEIPPSSIIVGRVMFGGSMIGSPAEIREMLQFAVDKKVKPWIETLPMRDANTAIVAMAESKARYRYVLVN